jgi:hypothetical protein
MDKNKPRFSIKVFINAGFSVYCVAEILKIIIDVDTVGKGMAFDKCLFFCSQRCFVAVLL